MRSWPQAVTDFSPGKAAQLVGLVALQQQIACSGRNEASSRAGSCDRSVILASRIFVRRNIAARRSGCDALSLHVQLPQGHRFAVEWGHGVRILGGSA